MGCGCGGKKFSGGARRPSSSANVSSEGLRLVQSSNVRQGATTGTVTSAKTLKRTTV